MSARRHFLPIAVAAAVAALTFLPAASQAQAKSEERATLSRGGMAGEDENIRIATGTNVRGEPGEQPPSAKAPAGTMTRGANDCRVHFDNRSNLFIAAYAQGTYRGELSPWGDVYTYVLAGETRLYARAGFTDGSVSTWGPRLIDCPAGGSYQWMLYQ
ncbi:MAG TPA: hypothetical protein PK788_12260 [Gemmatimonadaceae bacterium]|nr:hypothetical protein [Gemmatimonadaceae bacterium]HRQ77890.1 hypothetical protein [Gemmatimonadaceae bacterium]